MNGKLYRLKTILFEKYDKFSMEYDLFAQLVVADIVKNSNSIRDTFLRCSDGGVLGRRWDLSSQNFSGDSKL